MRKKFDSAWCRPAFARRIRKLYVVTYAEDPCNGRLAGREYVNDGSLGRDERADLRKRGLKWIETVFVPLKSSRNRVRKGVTKGKG